jgi:WD40 repeat protein
VPIARWIWHAQTGEAKLGGLPRLGHTDDVRVLASLPDVKTIAAGSRDESVRPWDAEAGEAKLGGRPFHHRCRMKPVAFVLDWQIIILLPRVRASELG